MPIYSGTVHRARCAVEAVLEYKCPHCNQKFSATVAAVGYGVARIPYFVVTGGDELAAEQARGKAMRAATQLVRLAPAHGVVCATRLRCGTFCGPHRPR